MSGINVWLRPSKGQTPDRIQADIDRSVSFIERLRGRGVESWWAKYHRIGPIRLGLAKEVGPPPWPWPKVYAGTQRWAISLGAGWRSTAYTVHVLWTRGNSTGGPA